MKFSKKYIYLLLFFGLLGIFLVFTPVGVKVKNRITGIVKGAKAANSIGQQLPSEAYDWELTDRHGNPFNFKSMQDKVVLINFWASWCDPCIQEMPSLQNLYKDYGHKIGFLFVAQDKASKVDQFMTKKGYDFPVYYSISRQPGLFVSRSMPTTYILDKSGKITLVKTGYNDWNEQETRAALDALL